MNRDEIRNLLVEEARSAAGKGPSWAQEGVVLRAVSARVSRHGVADLSVEQATLEVWHDLFAERVLAWGYNLDNPGAPFFHFRQSA